MNEEHLKHIPRVIGLVFVVGLISVFTVFFLSFSAEEDGTIRTIMLKIPIVKDLVPLKTIENDVDTSNVDINDPKEDLEILFDGEKKTEKKEGTETTSETKDIPKVNPVISDGKFLSNDPKTIEGEKKFKSLQLKEARDIFIAQKDIDSVANYYLGLISAYENDAKSVRAYMQKVKEKSASENLILKSNEIIKAFDEFNLYRGSSADHLAVLLGRAFLNVGEPNLGIVKLKEALKVNPYYKDALVILGAAYMMQDNYKEAEKYLVQAMPVDRAEPNYYLGLVRFNLGKFNDAVLAFEEAKKKGYKPEVDLRNKLGETYLKLNKAEEALAEFNRVIELTPLNPEVYYNPIWINLKLLNNYEKALYYAEANLNSNPTLALSQDLMGWVYLEAGQYQMAKKYLDAALDIDKNLFSAYFHLAKYYEANLDLEQAKAHYKMVVALSPDSSLGIEAKKALEKL